MLRYLSEDPEIRERLRALPQAEIGFNYHGQLDYTFNASSPFQITRSCAAETPSPRTNRAHLIEISGSVQGGRLRLVWTYCENAHRRETIVAMAERAQEALRELVAESLSSPDRSYIPSDFPLTTIDQQQLRKILSKRAKMKGDEPSNSPATNEG
jgi:non-ribosomal peptide synthase protein (TIGR01720 family)